MTAGLSLSFLTLRAHSQADKNKEVWLVEFNGKFDCGDGPCKETDENSADIGKDGSWKVWLTTVNQGRGDCGLKVREHIEEDEEIKRKPRLYSINKLRANTPKRLRCGRDVFQFTVEKLYGNAVDIKVEMRKPED